VDKKIKKIILTGPESTGKSTLAKRLARKHNTVWVPEFSRTYLEGLNRTYREDDLLKIAQVQQELESFFYKKSNQYLFCDTSMLVMKIWSEYRFGKCHPWILEKLENEKDTVYILCGTDVPWEYDEQRENPNDRNELYEKYLSELKFYQKEFIEVSGSQGVRLDFVADFLGFSE
jgi:NadR type nicotinamide-nucleotide adenylyltransferase